MPSARQATLIVWFTGMLVLVGLTVWYGADHVGQAIVSAGWAALLVVAIRAAAVAIAGGGWWLLFPADARPSVLLCAGLRFVREGANALFRWRRSAATSSARAALRCAACAERSLRRASSLTC